MFALAILVLVGTSLRNHPPPGFALSTLEPRPEPAALAPELTITVDARDASRWARLDLSRGILVEDSDPRGWDLAVRRFRLVVNGGRGFVGRAGAIRLSGRPFDSVSEAPADGYVTSRIGAGGDTAHAEFERWYRYGFFSHLLEPADAVYAIRTADGRYAKLEILGYYCPGAEPGCLTLRYVYQGDGSRRLAK